MNNKLKRNIILYLLYTFLSSFSFLSPYLSLYLMDNLKVPLSTFGLLMMVYQITKLLFEVPTGVVADKYSKKLSMLIGCCFIFLSFIMLYSHNIILLIISFFMKAIGYTFISGSFEAIFIDSLDENVLAKMNSIERVCFYLGFACSTISGGLFIHKFSYEFTIMLDILTILVMFVICLFIYEEKTRSIKETKEKSTLQLLLKDIFSNKVLFWMLVMDFATAVSFITLEDLYSAFLQQFGLSTTIIGITIALQFIISACIGFVVHYFIKKLNKTNLYIICSLLFVLFASCLYINNINWIFIPLFYILSDTCYSIYGPSQSGYSQSAPLLVHNLIATSWHFSRSLYSC